MRKIVVLFAIILSINCFATGLPYADVKLKPIATNYEGHVLFQTYSDINRHGSYSCKEEKFGWLVVSAYGLWDERVAYDTSEIFDAQSCEYKDRAKYLAYKRGEINLQNPDNTLKNMLKKYYFNRTVAQSNERFKILALKPKQSCFRGGCIDQTLTQKSIYGLHSNRLYNPSSRRVKNLRSSFYYKGVALFKSPSYISEEDSENRAKDRYASVFNLPKIEKGRHYGAEYIDSIVLIDPFKFREPKRAIKEEIESVVYKIIELLKERSVKSFTTLNTQYIHPKYGFYYINRMGAMDNYYHHKNFDIEELQTKDRAYTVVNFISGNSNCRVPKIQWRSTKFSCDTEKWLAKGLIVNDRSYNISSLYEFQKPTPKDRLRVAFLEKNRWSVYITEWDVIFELKKIDARWYIVLVNSVEADCSA